MKNYKKIILIVVDVVFIIVAILACHYLYQLELQKATFTSELEEFSKENENPIFKIGKIILYSSANAEDKSDGNLEDISISQFTDIAVYIDNQGKFQEITAENTVNEMFIDNIKITMNSEEGKRIFNYKNPDEFGKYSLISNYRDDRILMKIVRSNQEVMDNSSNNFYTDCSNPLTIGFINKDFITNGKVSDTSGQLAFDGSILRSANVDLKALSGKLEFFIHIQNNFGENFICNVEIDNDLTQNEEEILNGYSMRIINPEGEKYHFLKVSEK